jgi:site-specific recombinase XerD
METTLTAFAGGWERALAAFLAEKERRSGSRRTVVGYLRMLRHCFAAVGKPPDRLTAQDVFAWAYGRGPSGREPSAVTVGARLACLSSFYRFLIRMGVLRWNPCDAVQRPRPQPAPPRGLSGQEVQRLMGAMPATPVGLRDRAIVLTLVLTGRRRSEVLGLRRKDLVEESGRVYYLYRGKGGKRGKRELPRPAYEAIVQALRAYGKALEELGPEESLWPAGRSGGRGITSWTFYGNLRRYLAEAGLAPGGVHLLRHTAAKLRREAGESVEEVSRFLDHSSLAVTTTYLRRLEGPEDRSWQRVAAAIGAG